MLNKTTVMKIARKYAQEVKSYLNPTAVVLYGSYANGQAREHSDIDIAVILNGFTGDYLETSQKLYKLRRNISADIEPVLLDLQNDKTGFIDEVLKTGEILC
ncbi:MAG: nucleotidyltransferase domain-containing protein [Clostridiales bacterium]|jgi:predicted nucleotidyltransferase|nr:nucleotidyltransferase domain-containing protein [Clostridiales bacterium]